MKSADQEIRDIQHFGEEGGVVPVIDVASTSTFLDPADMERTFSGDLEGCYLYSRHSNPTVSFFGHKMAAMEGSEAALGVASGMAAISCTIDQMMRSGKKGGHMIASQTVYGGTYALFSHLLPARGIEVTFVDILNMEEVSKAIRPDTKIIYSETLSNPLLALTDIKSLSKMAKDHHIKLVIDNTFSPMIVRPILHGADVVIHSCTKYISGSSDLIAGAICGSQEFISSLIDVNHGSVMLSGPVMDPRIAHELYLRMDHLKLRMEGHSKMALYLANKMQSHGLDVVYPGLESHPQHSLMKTIFDKNIGYGGILTLKCQDAEKARQLATDLQKKKFGLYAVSLGFSRTLMSCSAKSTSSEIPESKRAEMGLVDGILRFSVGYSGDQEVMWERFLKVIKG